MSFTCTKHGWQHLLSACPLCAGSSLSSGSAVTFPADKLKEMRDEIAALKQQLAEAGEVIRQTYGDTARAFLQKIGVEK